jgi:carbon storage regulator
MLVIRRHPGEAIQIGEDVEIRVIECGNGRVKLGVTAPHRVPVMRSEVKATREQNLMAARALQDGTYLGQEMKFRSLAIQGSSGGTDT